MFRSGPSEGWFAREGVFSVGLPLAFFGFLRKGLPEQIKIRGCLRKYVFLSSGVTKNMKIRENC